MQNILFIQKNSRRLELSISKNTPHGRCGQGPGSVVPRLTAGLPFPVPEIPEFVACRDSGKFFQQFSRDFPGAFLENPRTDPGNSHSLLEFSDKLFILMIVFLVFLVLCMNIITLLQKSCHLNPILCYKQYCKTSACFSPTIVPVARWGGWPGCPGGLVVGWPGGPVARLPES